MLNSNILEHKYVVCDKNGNNIVDLTRATYVPTNNVTIRRAILVTKDYAGRPDLIAKATLGDASKFDYILKFNGISNPLSINEGEYLLIPDDEEFESNVIYPEYISAPQSEISIEEFIVKPKTESDISRLKALKKKAGNKVILPPNINADGEENITFTDETIIFGASTSGTICEETTTRKALRDMLKSKNIT